MPPMQMTDFFCWHRIKGGKLDEIFNDNLYGSNIKRKKKKIEGYYANKFKRTEMVLMCLCPVFK